jgi:hypothetical protein
MSLHRGVEGPHPPSILVENRGSPGRESGNTRWQSAALRALRECAVDLKGGLDHRRVGEWRKRRRATRPGGGCVLDRPATSWTASAPRRRISRRNSAHRTLSSAADVSAWTNVVSMAWPQRRLGRGRWKRLSARHQRGSLSCEDRLRPTTHRTSLDDEKAPTVDDRGGLTHVSEGRLATYAHGWPARPERSAADGWTSLTGIRSSNGHRKTVGFRRREPPPCSWHASAQLVGRAGLLSHSRLREKDRAMPKSHRARQSGGRAHRQRRRLHRPLARRPAGHPGRDPARPGDVVPQPCPAVSPQACGKVEALTPPPTCSRSTSCATTTTASSHTAAWGAAPGPRPTPPDRIPPGRYLPGIPGPTSFGRRRQRVVLNWLVYAAEDGWAW